MKELFLIRDNLANRISYYHLMLYLLSLPFDRFYSHLVLISFSLHTIIHFNRHTVKPVFTLRTLILQSVFLAAAISTIYASHLKDAFREWELYIPVVVFPVLFCINPLDLRKYRYNLLLVFALGCTATILYLYINALMTIRYYKLPFSTIISPAFTNHNFSQPIDMHATFFSLQIALALVFVLSVWLRESNRLNKLICGFCTIVLTAGIIQLSSKSAFLALFLIINIAIPYFLLQGRQKVRFITISAAITVLFMTVILNTRAFRDRFVNELKEDISQAKADENTDPRLARWEIAIDLVGKSPIIGYGAGSEIKLLQEQYYKHKFYRSYLSQLNAHNEYLSFLLKSGIWGLTIYISVLVYGFKKAMMKKDIVFFAFMLLLAVVSLSENILDADKGVMYYSFFFSFFVFIAEQKIRPTLPLKQRKYLREVATKAMAVTS
ncbi:MAG: O-antigen ligase family protein [Bacteroidetes bacterium]|nr:O-antigen ligase family protein [Bacteroidota bacterium]